MKQYNRTFTTSELETGVNLVGPKGYALALMSENHGFDSRGRLLVTLDVGHEFDPIVKDLERIPYTDAVAAGISDIYDAAKITIAVSGEVAQTLIRKADAGERAIAIEVMGLQLVGNRIDQSSGDPIEGQYLYNFTPNGVRLFELDWNSTHATKERGTAVQQERVVIKPKVDAAKIAAIKAAVVTTNPSKPQKSAADNAVPPTTGVSPMKVLAAAKRIGKTIDGATAKAIASVLDSDSLDMLNAATDIAEFDSVLDLAGIQA